MGWVIAHQGGWDEALLVAVPMALVVVLLWLAKRRLNRAELRSGHVNRPNSVVSGDQNESDPLDAGAHRGEASD